MELSEHDLQLGWERALWEARLDPFSTPDPCFFEASLRRHEYAEPLRQMPADYRPQPYLVADTSRGPATRARASLHPHDAQLLHACLVHCQPTLERLYKPRDAGLRLAPGVAWLRSPFSSLPLEQAAPEHARGRRRLLEELEAGQRWWLRADITNFTASLDRGQLLQALQRRGLPTRALRALRQLLEHLGLGPRRGLRSCGRVLHVLGRLYLEPVLSSLDERGHRYVHTDLDEFHFFFSERSQALTALDELTRLLEPLALHLNYQKTFVISRQRARAQATLARLSPAFLRHRLAAAAAAARSSADWVVQTLAESLYSSAFLHRRPGYRSLLATPAGQLALLRRLTDPLSRPGDRQRLRLFFSLAGLRAEGPLRRHLEARG